MSQSLRITRETKTGTTPHLNPQSEPTRVTRVGSRKHVAHASRPNNARRPRKGRPRTRSSRRKSRRGCTPRAHVWRRGFWGTLFPSFRTVCQYLSFAKLLTSRPGSWFRDRIPRRACRARARTVGARRVRTFGTRVTAFLGAASWSSRVLWEVQGRPDARCRRSTPCYEMSSDTASTGAVTEPVTAATALVAADPAAAMVSKALSNVMSDTAPAPNPAPEPEASAEVRISDHSSFRVPCFSRTYIHSVPTYRPLTRHTSCFTVTAPATSCCGTAACRGGCSRRAGARGTRERGGKRPRGGNQSDRDTEGGCRRGCQITRRGGGTRGVCRGGCGNTAGSGGGYTPSRCVRPGRSFGGWSAGKSYC